MSFVQEGVCFGRAGSHNFSMYMIFSIPPIIKLSVMEITSTTFPWGKGIFPLKYLAYCEIFLIRGVMFGWVSD